MKTIRIYSCNSLTFLAVLCATIFGAALLGACSGPDDHSGNGTVRINLGSGARSVTVTDEMKLAMVYDISLTSGTETVEQKQEKGIAAASFTVAPGVYAIAVRAYLNEQERENKNLFATGSGPVSVAAGKTSNVKITMKQAVETYRVMLVLGGGSYDGSSGDIYIIEVPADSLLSDYIDNEKLTPPQDGDNFAGWYDDAENEIILKETVVTKHIILYAVWGSSSPNNGDADIDVNIDWGSIVEKEGGKS